MLVEEGFQEYWSFAGLKQLDLSAGGLPQNARPHSQIRTGILKYVQRLCRVSVPTWLGSHRFSQHAQQCTFVFLVSLAWQEWDTLWLFCCRFKTCFSSSQSFIQGHGLEDKPAVHMNHRKHVKIRIEIQTKELIIRSIKSIRSSNAKNFLMSSMLG